MEMRVGLVWKEMGGEVGQVRGNEERACKESDIK